MGLPNRTRRARRETKGERVLQALMAYCDGLQPGDFVPPHQQLAQVFGASERAVRWALDELSHQGKIIRRQGARTQVAGPVVTLNGSGGKTTTESVGPLTVETRTIVAIAIPDRALFDQAMKLLVEQAKMEDVSVFCHLIPDTTVDPQAFLAQLPQKPLGFLLFRRELIAVGERLRAEGHRVVVVGTPFADVIPAVPVVYGNHKYGGYLVTKHLIDLGHRRIGCCAYGNWDSTLRCQGHRRALREAARNGIEVQERLIDLPRLRTDPAYAGEVFLGQEAPTGLTIWNDHEAIMVLGQLNRMGLRVPTDVSVVGYDDLPEGQAVHPPLTTVASSMEQQLDAAIDLLTSPTEPPTSHQVVVQPTLIWRGSSAAIAESK